MGKKMLIDAAHPEETRVVVVDGNRIEEFDYESAERKQLKGSIYLAKVTRVEPSLQAAFVDYGGNRHGFLAFSEIHPDYYQIPVADRQALLEEEEDDARASAADEEEAGDKASKPKRRSRRGRKSEKSDKETDAAGDGADEQLEADESEGSSDLDVPGSAEDGAEEQVEDGDPGVEEALEESDSRRVMSADASDDNDDSLSIDIADATDDGNDDENGDGDEDVAAASDDSDDSEDDDDADDSDDDVDSVGIEEDALEEVPERKRRKRRVYKIQEVIKRRQVILVQVVKEERGNKGAALTTYLSLAGRYCVLMPNTARGGGISRKITDASDRKRLKEVAKNLDIPEGTGLIVRTAGAQRTKTEIKRDFDYLLRLWENVRDLTLRSTAPNLVYEEGNLIKRSIRDLYTKDVDEVLVEGEPAHKQAKEFMKMLMPSHARNVKLFKETRPLFSRHNVDDQLDKLFSPVVTLKSGGYLVINQTEALVSIDINSGKATREHNIEDTALKTNIEAAEEIARQLRLRDLAGLIVIDFIDMEEKRNNRTVERKLKDALKNERARIQVGRISHFGLLEMSRQRLRQGMLENSTRACPHCEGTGLIRSLSSCALSVLRSIEDHLLSKKTDNLTVRCDREVAFYILNEKRYHLLSLESSYGVFVFLEPSSDVLPSECEIHRGIDRIVPSQPLQISTAKQDAAGVAETDETSEEDARSASEENEHEERDDSEDQGKKRRRRRGRRGGRKARERDNTAAANADGDEAAAPSSDDQDANTADVSDAEDQNTSAASSETAASDGAEAEEEPKPRKRARRSRKKAADEQPQTDEAPAKEEADAPAQAADASSQPAEDEPAEKPKRARKPRKPAKKTAAAETENGSTPDTEQPAPSGNGNSEPAPSGNGDAASEHKTTEVAEAEAETRTWTPPAPTAEVEGPPKRGWWSKR